MQRTRFVARGQVQGVGFRPFIFTLAEECGLTGFVHNSPRGVVIEVQGETGSLGRFRLGLGNRLPPLARITGLEEESLDLVPEEVAFSIAASTAGDSHAVLIGPDTAVCPDCLADMSAPEGRRFGYPFTNCTNCGPRYTITRSIPYDRPFTSMACFPLCPECGKEYADPRDRRFHAQPNACPACGPAVWLVDNADVAPGRDSGLAAARYRGDAALAELAGILIQGGIAAIKGLGGFHLACDARDEAAVARLRARKHRPHKPFAVMAAGLEEARSFARISREAEDLLTSPERPIVLCPLLAPGQGRAISSLVSPDTSLVGVMLPYTPLHQALFAHVRSVPEQELSFPPSPGPLSVRPGSAFFAARERSRRSFALVMTSGNRAGEPICLGNREALDALGDMADVFLLHNRDILIRVDDSVVRPLSGRGTLFFRRARGYVPGPLPLLSEENKETGLPSQTPATVNQVNNRGLQGAQPLAEGVRGGGLPRLSVLGVGAELKNTLCLTKDGDAFVSQHIGDMSNLETSAFHREIREHLGGLLKVSPALVVRDLHPDYPAGAMAEEFAAERGLPVRVLQHHFAHAHAVLTENGVSGPALVLALDGTGLGEDGLLWGGELLFVDASMPGREPLHRRLAHFAPLALPGGEAAIREPWRIAHALLLELGLIRPGAEAGLPWLPAQAATAGLLPSMLQRRINTPRSTSCGRLFDAVSALLGLCLVTTHEGQAAIRLEEAQYGKIPETAGLGTDSGVVVEPLSGVVPDARQDRRGSTVCAEDVLYPCPLGAAPDVGSGSAHVANFTGDPESAVSPCRQLDTHALFAALFADWRQGTPVDVVARRFHASLAAALTQAAAHFAAVFSSTDPGGRVLTRVGLSGGCMQNVTLVERLSKGLEDRGLIPLLHKNLPPGDGCISFGQAAWGSLTVNR